MGTNSSKEAAFRAVGHLYVKHDTPRMMKHPEAKNLQNLQYWKVDTTSAVTDLQPMSPPVMTRVTALDQTNKSTMEWKGTSPTGGRGLS